MGIVRRTHFTDLDWLNIGPIAPHIGAIKQHFADGRYAPTTVASYLSNIAHFARWCADEHLPLCMGGDTQEVRRIAASELLLVLTCCLT